MAAQLIFFLFNLAPQSVCGAAYILGGSSLLSETFLEKPHREA